MGTRHLQMVINKKKEIKLSQYGQWDGYPSGQGLSILKFLRECDMDKYEAECDKLRPITESEDKMVEQDKEWNKKWPYMSRDCGSKIHQMIQYGSVEFVGLIDQKEANKWCEGFYTIDFSEGIFTSEFHGKVAVYPLSNLPTEEQYLQDMQDEEF